ncbi:MAG: tRNA (adenosine(37)-N6)-dimethylallyltransferase MiaA [Bacilli bacterium]|nr:tRNA (adenosine(37)-N6)-dimethylallyltransferase MiaA [Bacilli bacterium]MBO6194901.1 tRNA (adenosine(37)-N6)-dimethylallyltransferase MiaA [Bacilli bacterium]
MIIVITGPTAVGKTKMSIELAKKYNAEIINSDSVQVYKKMDIASAKVTEEEKEGIPHHLLDIKEYNEDYTVYDYQKDARNMIDKLQKENKNIIMVGGTGLYIKAALYDYRFNKEESNKTYENLTNEELYKRIMKLNPNSKVDKNNNRRLVRELINLENNSENDLGDNLLYKDVYFIGLTTKRDVLYDRINKRVDIMMENGLIEEAKYFYNLDKNAKSLKTVIGYKELFKYFDNEITKEEALDLIKKNSRHYAKRQYTWFNNKMNIKWFDVDFDNFDNTIKEVVNYIK